MTSSPLETLLGFLWEPISSLSPYDILMVLALGLVLDLGWGYGARLAGALKGRRDTGKDTERNTELKTQRDNLTNRLDELNNKIADVDAHYRRAMKDIERLQHSERLMLEQYQPRLCPFCKAINFSDAQYCDQCGRRIPEDRAVACFECKSLGPAGTRYCAQCGKTMPRYCPACWILNRDEAVTCVRCKARLPEVHYTKPEAIIAAAEEKLKEEHSGDRARILAMLDAKKSELVDLGEERAQTRKKLEGITAEIDRLKQEATPFVSLLVPCHNSESVIEDTLRSLTTLQYERKQIVAVDDASTDRTYELAKKYSDKVTLVKRATSTGRKTGAINFGLSFAKGDTIVVVDDDTTLKPDALRNMVVALANKEVAAVAGNVKVKAHDYNLLARLQSTEYLVSMELGRPFQNSFYRALFVISGCFGAFRRDVLEKIGQYDADIITEDLDVTWKIYKLRGRIAYRRDAICYTDAPTSLKALYRQRLRWDKGLLEVLSKHRNAFLNSRFGYVGLLLLPDTLITEVALLLMRPAWLLYLISFHYPILPALLLTVYFYVCLEFLATFTAGVLSETRKNTLKCFYAPLMFVYRQLLGLIRFSALVNHVLGRKMRW